ncbi:hypothetical protein EJ08DRAFT_676399 [Tothia fuscella]|uniref:Uncharacterized protein n=1 Tax=Tothia fuscella TaxID=1048955 RepID=A0A9P4U2H7_9PEZI|nr:hypothetical protein EJ08DRAFT_676399 [Tothia fuscella]
MGNCFSRSQQTRAQPKSAAHIRAQTQTPELLKFQQELLRKRSKNCNGWKPAPPTEEELIDVYDTNLASWFDNLIKQPTEMLSTSVVSNYFAKDGSIPASKRDKLAKRYICVPIAAPDLREYILPVPEEYATKIRCWQDQNPVEAALRGNEREKSEWRWNREIGRFERIESV